MKYSLQSEFLLKNSITSLEIRTQGPNLNTYDFYQLE
jgi:hypothetical protein